MIAKEALVSHDMVGVTRFRVSLPRFRKAYGDTGRICMATKPPVTSNHPVT